MSGFRSSRLVCSVLATIVVAFSSTSARQNGDLRLVGGDSSAEGRVEVYYDGTWGTVCDDSWHMRDANVVCRQLGFVRAARIWYRAHFGQGSGPIWLDQVACSRDDRSILECDHNGWGIHDCRHAEDASVRCVRPTIVKPATLPVRLSCPTYVQNGTCNVCPDKLHPSPTDCSPVQPAVQGIVEVLYNGTWRPVSGDGWNAKASSVVCGELGYPVGFVASPPIDTLWPNWNGTWCSRIGSGSGDFADSQCGVFPVIENEAFRMKLGLTLLQQLECTGKERILRNCYFSGLGPYHNPSMNVATVKCGFFPPRECSSNIEVRVQD